MNRQKNAIFYIFSFATQQISFIPQIEEQGEILIKKLHISYIDQFVVPPIFSYLIGAKKCGDSSDSTPVTETVVRGTVSGILL